MSPSGDIMPLHAENPQLYLAAEYWFAKPGDEAEVSSVRMGSPPMRVSIPAYRALNAYLDDGAERGQLRAFSPGETFDPKDQDPGAIVALSQEKLYYPADWNQISWGTISTPVPRPDFTLTRDKEAIGRQASRERVEGARYERSSRWGIVVPPVRKFSENSLYVVGMRPGNNFATPGVLFPDRFVVGKTERTVNSLRRINALEICTNGKRQKEHQSALAFLRGWMARFGLST